MDVESTAADDSSPYPALFREYVLRSAQQNLTSLQFEPTKREWTTLERAIHSLSFALELDAGWPISRELLLTLSPELERAGLRDEWAPYLERGIHRSIKREEWTTAAELLLQLGLLHQLVGEYEEAVENYAHAINYSEQANDKQLHARSLNWLAFQLYLLNDYDQATELVTTAQKMLDETDVARVGGYRVLGRIAFNREKWAEAEQHFRNMYQLCLATGKKRKIAHALRDLGPALQAQGKFEEAISCQKNAMKLFHVVSDSLQEAVTSMNLGTAYFLMGQDTKALEYYQESAPLFRENNDNLHLAIAYHNIGYMLMEQGSLDVAEDYYQRSIRIRTGLHDNRGLIESIQDLGKIYLRKHDYRQATEKFRQVLSIINLERDDPIMNRYQNETDELLQRATRLNHAR